MVVTHCFSIHSPLVTITTKHRSALGFSLWHIHTHTHINACVADTMNSTFRLPPSPLNDDARGNHNMIALPKHDSRAIPRLLFHLFSTDYVWERPWSTFEEKDIGMMSFPVAREHKKSKLFFATQYIHSLTLTHTHTRIHSFISLSLFSFLIPHSTTLSHVGIPANQAIPSQQHQSLLHQQRWQWRHYFTKRSQKVRGGCSTCWRRKVGSTTTPFLCWIGTL